jgi:hypothetical protein
MHLKITLDDDLLREVDARVGERGRAAFVTAAVRAALDDVRRWESVESALGSIPDAGHLWDADPAGWVHAERRSGGARVG